MQEARAVGPGEAGKGAQVQRCATGLHAAHGRDVAADPRSASAGLWPRRSEGFGNCNVLFRCSSQEMAVTLSL